MCINKCSLLQSASPLAGRYGICFTPGCYQVCEVLALLGADPGCLQQFHIRFIDFLIQILQYLAFRADKYLFSAELIGQICNVEAPLGSGLHFEVLGARLCILKHKYTHFSIESLWMQWLCMSSGFCAMKKL